MNEQANLKTIMLMEDYSDRVLHGDEDADEGLQNAIDWAFRDRNDEFRSNLYTSIMERWTNHPYILRFVDAYEAIEEAIRE